VAATNLILDEQEGPAVLVGHSYGGVVITEAGMHPKVRGPSSTSPPSFRTKASPSTPSSATRRPLRRRRRDISSKTRRRWRPRSALMWIPRPLPSGPKAKCVWPGCERWRGHRARVEGEAELVSRGHGRQDDPPPAQRQMSKRAGSTVVEVPGSHAIYVSNPARWRR